MNKANALKGCPLLSGIPPEDLRRDCPSTRIVAIRHRVTIYQQDESGRTVFCVLDGQVIIEMVSHDGATLTTAALGAGDFFGPALSGATAAEDTARAKGTISIWRAPIDEFRRLYLHHPQVAWEFVSLLAGAGVQFTPEDPHSARLRLVTLADGVATIHANSTTDEMGELLVRMNNRTLLKQRLAIAGRPDQPVPSLEWPDPVIVQIESLTGSDGKTRPGLHEALSGLFLTHGINVPPPQPSRDAILDEQAVQLAGPVSDQSAVTTGRLVHPTVILNGSQSQEAGLSLTLTTVKTGEEREVHLRRLEDLPDLLPASTRRYNEQAYYKIPIDP